MRLITILAADRLENALFVNIFVLGGIEILGDVVHGATGDFYAGHHRALQSHDEPAGNRGVGIGIGCVAQPPPGGILRFNAELYGPFRRGPR